MPHSVNAADLLQLSTSHDSPEVAAAADVLSVALSIQVETVTTLLEENGVSVGEPVHSADALVDLLVDYSDDLPENVRELVDVKDTVDADSVSLLADIEATLSDDGSTATACSNVEDAMAQLGNALATAMGISSQGADNSGISFGGLLAFFGPAHDGQEIPAELVEFDVNSDWAQEQAA